MIADLYDKTHAILDSYPKQEASSMNGKCGKIVTVDMKRFGPRKKEKLQPNARSANSFWERKKKGKYYWGLASAICTGFKLKIK